MVLPGYTTMQEIISQAAIREEARLFQLVDSRLTPPIKGELDSILNSDDKLNTVRDLKQDLSGFNYNAMKKEIYRTKETRPINTSLLPSMPV